MRAIDIATPLPVVDHATLAADAVRLIAREDLLGLVVTADDGRPWVVVSSVDVARIMLPEYARQDLSLANVMGEIGIDDLHDELRGKTVGDLVDDGAVDPKDVLTVRADAHLVEIAARMVDLRTQVALVEDDTATEPVFVTLPAVFDALVTAWDSAADGRSTR